MMKLRSSLVLILFAFGCMAETAISQKPPIPNPILVLTAVEQFDSAGKQFTRYRFEVFNRADLPNNMFAAAPQLPPCGANAKSSRTWLDFFDQRGKRLYGFCALSNPDDLKSIWFTLERDLLPPSWVYIELNDRQTNTKYKSNLAETSL